MFSVYRFKSSPYFMIENKQIFAWIPMIIYQKQFIFSRVKNFFARISIIIPEKILSFTREIENYDTKFIAKEIKQWKAYHHHFWIYQTLTRTQSSSLSSPIRNWNSSFIIEQNSKRKIDFLKVKMIFLLQNKIIKLIMSFHCILCHYLRIL